MRHGGGRLVALSTVGSAQDAERVARALVERRLAACVNVVPGLVSHYRWKGELCRDEERLLVIKTRRERLSALRAALLELHPYELPELVALPVAAGHTAYLRWLDEGVTLPGRGRAEETRSLEARARRAPARGRPPGRRRPRSRR